MRSGRKREFVDAMRGEWDVSIRRACRVIEMDTSSYHYRSRRPDQAGLKARIKEICATRVRMATGASTRFCSGRAGT